MSSPVIGNNRNLPSLIKSETIDFAGVESLTRIRCVICNSFKKPVDENPTEPPCTCTEVVAEVTMIKSEPSLDSDVSKLISSSDSTLLNTPLSVPFVKLPNTHPSFLNTSFFNENLAFFKCPNCPFRTYNKRSYTVHKLVHGVTVKLFCCPKCQTESYDVNSNSDDSLKSSEDLSKDLEYPYLCYNCGYRCKEKSHLRLHILDKHTHSSTFKCSFCSFTTSFKETLRDHKKIHVGEKRHECSSCEFKCAYKQSLLRHIMRKHSNERPFQCHDCPFATTNSSDLIRHRRRHTGEVFPCPECDFKCTRKDNLKKHERLKHSEEARAKMLLRARKRRAKKEQNAKDRALKSKPSMI